MVLKDCLAYAEGLPTGLRHDTGYHITEQASQRVHLPNKATLDPYYTHSSGANPSGPKIPLPNTISA